MEKTEVLKEYIRSLGSVAVAFSGGADSALLLKTAHDVLGSDCIALTADLAFVPPREIESAKEFCKKEGIKHIIVKTDDSELERAFENPPDRCYICKKLIFEKMLKTALENGAKYVAEGSNTDDKGDYRPGLRAIAELGIKSPLIYANISKAEVREYSKKLALASADKPSMACLASRFVYGERITREKLEMTDRAEMFLQSLGFRQLRVRVHQNLARIEVLPCDFPLMTKKAEEVYTALKNIGFDYVSLDLRGYRTGSMNETLTKN